MSNRDRILATLAKAPGPLCDDCLAEEVPLKRRQIANAECKILADGGRIVRSKHGSCANCGKTKDVSSITGSASTSPPVLNTLPRRSPTLAVRGWRTQRMVERVQQLTDGFDHYVDAFNKAKLFTGPSLYFHHRTLERLRSNSSPTAALNDDQFIESLYAMLTAWGMHRMGPGSAKLVEFPEFKASFQVQSTRIEKLASLRIRDIAGQDVDRVAAKIWDTINGLSIGVGQTKIVVGSKALHHLLPELVPPIDRTYTIRFFFNQLNMPGGDERPFKAMYPQFHRISVACRHQIESHLGTGMNTSQTKVIDNAIVGYVLNHLKLPRAIT